MSRFHDAPGTLATSIFNALLITSAAVRPESKHVVHHLNNDANLSARIQVESTERQLVENVATPAALELRSIAHWVKPPFRTLEAAMLNLSSSRLVVPKVQARSDDTESMTNQRCKKAPVCDEGSCDQRGAEDPTCNGGGCKQQGAKRPRCNPYASDIIKTCDQSKAKEPHCEGSKQITLKKEFAQEVGDAEARKLGCDQSSSISPVCIFGHCDQSSSTGARCPGGWCDQEGVKGNSECSDNCLQIDVDTDGQVTCKANDCITDIKTVLVGTCPTGGCYQQGMEKPTCEKGRCDQSGSVEASCAAGHCDQSGSKAASCTEGHCDQSESEAAVCEGGHCDREDAENSKDDCKTCIHAEEPDFSDCKSHSACIFGLAFAVGLVCLETIATTIRPFTNV